MGKKAIFTYFLVSTCILLTGIILLIIKFDSVGGSLIATGSSGYLIYWATYVNEKRLKKDTILLKSLEKQGIIGIYDRRLLYDDYNAKCLKTKKNYDMMGFGLSTFIEDNKHKLQEWSKRFKIRILILNPKNPNCYQRDYEEKDEKGKLLKDILKITLIILKFKNPRIELKWYNAIPVTNILRMDDIMWVGPYFINERSRNAYVLKLQQDGELFKKYIDHFETIWNDPHLSYSPQIQDVQSFFKRNPIKE